MHNWSPTSRHQLPCRAWDTGTTVTNFSVFHFTLLAGCPTKMQRRYTSACACSHTTGDGTLHHTQCGASLLCPGTAVLEVSVSCETVAAEVRNASPPGGRLNIDVSMDRELCLSARRYKPSPLRAPEKSA